MEQLRIPPGSAMHMITPSPLCVSYCILHAVRLILHYSQQVESKGAGYSREKATLYERLGDLCCDVKAYSPALKFYGKQVSSGNSLFITTSPSVAGLGVLFEKSSRAKNFVPAIAVEPLQTSYPYNEDQCLN